MEGECAICRSTTTHKCSKCCKAYYCTKEHQQQHWKSHKKECYPFIMKQDKVVGRHLVATKNIKAGEIVFKEKPLIIGPSQITAPVCLGCYKLIDEKTSVPCERCGWPVCNSKCQESPNHLPECELTAARGQKVNIQSFGLVHPNYLSLTVVRCLHLKKSNPQCWEKLIKLESHCKERKETEKWQSDLVQIAQFARRFYKLEDEFSDDEIMKVCGIVQINAHEVPFTEPPFVAVFDVTSMIEHNCKANCSKSFTDRGEVLIASAVNIAAGENLSICYTDPLWGTINRRHHLEETKYFKCMCNRCKDVTEMGSMFSALKCRRQQCNGYALPKSMAVEDNLGEDDSIVYPDWSCNVCNEAIKGEAAQTLIQHVGEDLNAMEKGNSDACLKFLNHYGKYLHPSHYYMIDVKLAFAQLIGQDNEDGLSGVNNERLALKVDLCRQVSEFLEKIVPAEVRGRGMVLFELHAAIAESGRRKALYSEEGPGVLIEHLLESKKYLEKAVELMKYESKYMPEGKIATQGVKNLSDMDVLLKKLYASLDNSPM